MSEEVISVTEVPFGVRCNTRLWFSKRVWKVMGRYRDGRIHTKLKHCCQAGLWLFEGVIPPIVRHEGDGVYRIGFTFSLFRIIGFYESRQDFICIDAFEKGKTKLNASERERIARVADVRKNGNWRKDNEYPKLASND
jgi:hypothetical protein